MKKFTKINIDPDTPLGLLVKSRRDVHLPTRCKPSKKVYKRSKRVTLSD